MFRPLRPLHVLLPLLLFACNGGPSSAPPARPSAAAPATLPPEVPPTVAPPPVPTTAAAAAMAPATEPPILSRWADMKSAEKACVDCHVDVAEAWAKTKMGHSLTPYTGQGHAPFRTPATVVHPLTGLTYLQNNGKFIERAAPGVEISATPKYVVGSGTHAHSYFWGEADRLYQLPLTWFTARNAWDLSPGYESMVENPGFYREVTTACLNCHTDPIPAKPGTKNRLLTLPQGPIGCSRCHGDGRSHAEMRLRGKDSGIVMPNRLDPARAADICAACHFGGAVRVVRAGHVPADFLPGQKLSDVVAVFVRQQSGQGVGTVDHFSRLAMSKCAKANPTMTCNTCHPPHVTDTDVATDRSAQCRGCHGEKGMAAKHPCTGPVAPDCASCHMDLGPARNIPHVSSVDHYIRVHPEAAPPQTNDSPLVWVTHPDPEPTDPDEQILLGRAYVDAWRSDHQDRDAERAEQFLTRGLGVLTNRTDGWLELATLRRLRGDSAGQAEAAEHALAGASEDRRLAVSVAAARMTNNDPAAALTLLDQAAVLADRAEIETLRARALEMLNRPDDALDAARTATRLQPTYAEGWLALGLMHLAAKHAEEAVPALVRATQWQPQDLRAWLNLGAAQAMLKHFKESKAAYEQAAKRADKDEKARNLAILGMCEAMVSIGEATQAVEYLEELYKKGVREPTMPRIMGRAFLQSGNFKEARGALEAAVQIAPNDASIWDDLATARREAGDAGASAQATEQAAALRRKAPPKGK